MTQVNEDILKQKVQRWIVMGSVLLLVCKFVAFAITNSVGILTDAMESIVNVAAGFISLYSLHIAAKPKDEDHPFGHGKVEFVSASFEGILIIIAGGSIIFEGIKRLFIPSVIEKLDIGIIIVAVSGLINYLMGAYSIYTGKKYRSMALVAEGRHLQSDTYSTIGLVAGLLILYFTRIAWIDSALALIFGGIIVITGISILRKTIANLLDRADSELLKGLVEVISRNRQVYWIDIHNLKMIQYGSYYYIDCDLTLPWYYTIKQGHEAAEKLKEIILTGYSEKVQVSIHSDSCNEKYCKHCGIQDCLYRKFPFVSLLPFSLKEITESDEDRNEK